MIFAVGISVISMVFGFYKNIEANNAKAFAYEQAYRIINVVPASLRAAALSKLAPVPAVIDLSRSSADVGSEETCSVAKRDSCTALAADLAEANRSCTQKISGACAAVDALQHQVVADACIACFK